MLRRDLVPNSQKPNPSARQQFGSAYFCSTRGHRAVRQKLVFHGSKLRGYRENAAMHFSPKALLVFIGFFVLLALALSSNGGGWFYVAEAVATVVILLGVAGLLRERRV